MVARGVPETQGCFWRKEERKRGRIHLRRKVLSIATHAADTPSHDRRYYVAFPASKSRSFPVEIRHSRFPFFVVSCRTEHPRRRYEERTLTLRYSHRRLPQRSCLDG